MKHLRHALFVIFMACAPIFAQAAAWTDAAENAITDCVFRGQSCTFPSTWYVALYTVCPTDSSPGTEVTNANGYARVSVGANALTNWASTQGDTSASTGTSGTTSNLATITFPTVVTSSWGTIVCFGLVSSGTYGAGTLWVYSTITSPPTLTVGATGSFAADTMTVQVDN